MKILRLATFAAMVLALPAAGQTWKVDKQIACDFPGQKKHINRQYDANGTRVFDLRITGARGDSNVVITESGDYLIKSVPTRLQFLPEPVTTVLNSIFREPANTSNLLERTTYQVDVEQVGQPPVRLEIDATGRVRDITSAAQVAAELRSVVYEQVKWREGDEVSSKLAAYFENARIKEIRRNPGTPGFYYAELTADRGTRMIQIVMDSRKEIPVWKYQTRVDELPKPVLGTIKELVGRGKIGLIMKTKSSVYRIEQPVKDDTLVIDVKPTGDVVAVTGNLSQAAEERYIPRRGSDRVGDLRDR